MVKGICVLAVTSLVVIGCGDYHTNYDTPSPAGVQNAQGGTETLSFATVEAAVFEPNRCTTCHSTANHKGGVVLDSYPLKGSLSDIMSEVQTGDMPIGGPTVPANEQAILQAWINAGAPETSSLPLPSGSAQ